MTNNIDIINAAIALIIKATVLLPDSLEEPAQRSLKRLSKMDADEKDKEILFLRDKVDQQQMQITILQKGLQKKQTNDIHSGKSSSSFAIWKPFRFPDAE